MKQYLFIILVACATTSVYSQNKKPSTTYGVQVGGALANLHVEGAITGDTKMKFGMVGGLFANIPLNTEFSLQPELWYQRLGGQNKANEVVLHMNYLTIPLLAKYRLDQSGFNVFAGLQYGILLQADLVEQGDKTDLKEDLKKGELSYVGGIEFMPGRLGIGARYQGGLSNIAKEGDVMTMQNNAILVTIAIRF